MYGPASVRVEQLTAALGGSSLARTALLLSLLHCAAFIATGLILVRMASPSGNGGRAALLWLANPLMIDELVAGSHVDALVVLLIVVGFALLRRSRFLAGLFVGVAVATKVNAVLVGLGMAWADRRSPKRLAALALGGIVAVGGLYLTISGHALDQTRRASKFVSSSTPWWPFATALRHTVGRATTPLAVSAGVLVLAVFLGRALLRLVPERRRRGRPRGAVVVRLHARLAVRGPVPAAVVRLDGLGDRTARRGVARRHAPRGAHHVAGARRAARVACVHFSPAFDGVVVALHSVVAPIGLLAIIVITLRRGRARRATAVIPPSSAPPSSGPALDEPPSLLEPVYRTGTGRGRVAASSTGSASDPA